MSLYLYYFLNGDGSAPMFDSAEAETAEEALQLGVWMLRRAPERAALEVWRGESRITTIRRDELSACG